MLTPTTKQSEGTALDRLPKSLSAAVRRERVRVSSFGGSDMGKGAAWGIANMYNLSPRMSPSLSTRPRRELLRASPRSMAGKHHGMAMMGKDLYVARGTCLYRIPNVLNFAETPSVETVGTLTDTDKCMTVFKDCLLIYPDKQYVGAADGMMRSMEVDSGIVEGIEFSGNTITLPVGRYWSAFGFREGDAMYVKSYSGEMPAPVGRYIIRKLTSSQAVVDTVFSTPVSGDARLIRSVPDLSAVTVCNDRLYGYGGEDIYVSEEGAPFAWQVRPYDKERFYAVTGNTDAPYTACASCGQDAIFFKEFSVTRITGGSVNALTISEMNTVGISAERAHALCEVDGDLFYYGFDGVYRYDRIERRPERVGKIFDGKAHAARAVKYDEGYHVCVIGEGEGGETKCCRALYVPNTRAWYMEDDTEMIDGVRLGAYLCSVDEGGNFWLSRTDGRVAGCRADAEREKEPVHAFVSLVPDHSHEPDGFRPAELYLRVTSQDESGGEGGGENEMRVLCSFADGRSGMDAEMPTMTRDGEMSEHVCEIACISGIMKDRLLRIPLPPRHCDYLILALEMRGDWVLHDLILEYETRR